MFALCFFLLIMGIVFRQSIKTTIVILAGAVLGAIVNLGYIYVLDKQAVGVVRMIFAQASVLQFLVLMGMGGTLMTFIQRYASVTKQRVLLLIAALVPLGSCLLLLVPYIFFSDNIIGLYKPEDALLIRKFYYWIPVLVLLWAILGQMESFLYSQHKTAIGNFMREVVLKILNIGLIILLWYKWIDFNVFVITSLLLYAVPTLLLLPIALRTKIFGFSADWKIFSRKEYGELAHFSWYHLLMGISLYSLGQVDTYMLGIFSKNGLATLAVYTFAVFITTVMTAPFRAMSSAAFPALNATFIDGDSIKLKHIFHRSSINMLIVAVAMAAIIGCNLNNAVAILPKGKGYEAIIPVALIMMIGRLIDMATGLNTELISISKHYKFNFYISGILVVLLILLNRILIPHFDIYGAAWGTTIAVIIFNIGKMIFLWQKMGIQPFSSSSVVIVLAGMITALAGYFLPKLPNVFLDVAVRTLVIILVFAALLIWWKPSEDLRTYLKSIRENKRLF